MPRTPRSFQTTRALIFHVVNRGILRQTIFHDGRDFQAFLHCLRRYAQPPQAKVYHWCLMPNHYHVVVELTEAARLSTLVAGWQQVYAAGYHHRHETAGRLFQGRFKSQAIDRDQYLLACGRYVERNPVRAGLCAEAWLWPWSSARFYVDQHDDALTACDPLWDREQADRYRAWLMEAEGEKDREFRSSAEALGDPEFTVRLHHRAGRWTLRGRGRRPFGRISP